MHLRDAHYGGASQLGHGKGYEYPHDDPRGWAPQQYLPDEMRDASFYVPSEHGFEQEIGTRMERLRAADRERGAEPGATGEGDDR
jgi:putative ATPase